MDGGRHQRLQQRPFTVLQLVCLAQPRPHILAASDFGSGHRELPRIFANPMESQPTEITQLLFRSGSKCWTERTSFRRSSAKSNGY